MSPRSSIAFARNVAARYSSLAGAFLGQLGAWMRRNRMMAAIFANVEDIWTNLVDAFCELVDPVVQRYFPERRLVAVAGADDRLSLFSVSNQKAVAVSALEISGLDSRISWSTVELRLRNDQVLRQTLALPAASRDFLGPVIEHRLERLTPWRREDVLYGYYVAPGPGSNGSISVHFAATSVAIAAGPLAALREAGFAASALGPGENVSAEMEIDFYRKNIRRRQAGWTRNAIRVWFGSVTAIVVMLAFVSVWAANARASRDLSQSHLLKARRLLKAASDGATGTRERELIALKAPDKSVVLLIDKLANVIPSTAYLRELTITPDHVALSGVSTDAAALIGLLDQAGLQDVHFTAPITRDAGRTDHFEISASRSASKSQDTP